MGLVFLHLFTGGERPLPITIRIFPSNQTYQVNLDILHKFRKDTESILFIDLIRKMIREIPGSRSTRELLIKHAVFMNITDRVAVVQSFATSFLFDSNEQDNKNRIAIIDGKKLHMKGILSAKREELENFLTVMNETYLNLDLNINVCSSLLQMFASQVKKF